MGTQFTEHSSRRPTNLHTNYSELVDRVNAQRFKSMVRAADDRRSAEPSLGIPFAFERPEAAAAHREFEEELKPAAAEMANARPSVRSIGSAAGISMGSFLMAFGSVFGLVCAYAIARSFK
jgi:hypothetical protein